MDATGEEEDATEMETAADASLANDGTLNKNNCLDNDCGDENSKDTSRGSSDTSNCPDPATMDLSDLLKHHVERRCVEQEEKKMVEQTENSTGHHPMEIQSKQQEPILVPDIFLDDEDDMTFDLWGSRLSEWQICLLFIIYFSFLLLPPFLTATEWWVYKAWHHFSLCSFVLIVVILECKLF